MELKAKRAVVTGSTKGIGRALVQILVEEEVNVVVSSRTQDDVQETVDELSKLKTARVVGKTCDVRRADQVAGLIQYCVAHLGGIDILVNNAGIGLFRSVEEMSQEDWRDTLATNLDGVFYGCHYAIPEMKKNGKGFIINIASLAGKNAFPKGAAYNASKFGLVGFSEALMQEIRHDGIQVAYIMPGSVSTKFGDSQNEAAWKLSANDVAEVVVQTLKHHSRCLTSRVEMRPSRPPK